MTRSTSLDTDTRNEDRGDSTPGPEGKRRGTTTPPPRSAHDPAEGKPAGTENGTPPRRAPSGEHGRT
ncbi:hypothetical protein [Burkholderia sola]|uniref:hypothetical protein n=1 Tax=Burkholderia sola TaxID=2843302 RepID=UPI0023DDA028|nr:hypothetical protein [Burkholderia sola]MDF3084077.1 hypothetical protein [Burkholderia sola]